MTIARITSNPIFLKDKNKWRVGFVDLDGKKRSKTFPNEPTAMAFIEKAQMKIKDNPVSDMIPLPDGTSRWWQDRLADIAVRMLNGDSSPQTLSVARTLATVASAAHKHVEVADLERRVRELEAAEVEIGSARLNDVGTELAQSYKPAGNSLPS